MSEWQSIETVPEKTDVLLLWPCPDTDPIVRIGNLRWRPFGNDKPIFKLEIDYGHCGAWVYTDQDDCPTHWHPVPQLPAISETEPGEGPDALPGMPRVL